MTIKKLFFLSAVLVIMFNRCSTDVDIYADYKDITVVYGLLDQADDTIWLKITKAYLGEGNALHFAQNPDSSNYPYKLNVVLSGMRNGSEVRHIVFDTITIHNKKPGDSIFYYPNQLMYYAVPAQPLDKEAIYKLIIEKRDGTIEAEAGLIGDFAVTQPVYTISFNVDKELVWKAAQNGKRYEVKFTFHYRELGQGSNDTLNKSISWSLGVRKSVNTDGNEVLTIPYSGERFFKLLENNLDKDPNVTRWSGKVDAVLACGDLVLDTYIEINNATSGLLTELPQYTNIKGEKATGVFAARHTLVKPFKLAVVSERKLVEDYPELGFELNH